MITARIPVLGFVAYSGTGKTTLLEQLIPLLKAHGLRIGMVKHTHHDFDIDQPGKDSYRLRKAGASQMMVASKRRWALMVEHDEMQDDPALAELLTHFDQDALDLILVEGFKHEHMPRIEVHRSTEGKPWLFPHDPNVIALAVDDASGVDTRLPLLDINQPGQVASFIIDWAGRQVT